MENHKGESFQLHTEKPVATQAGVEVKVKVFWFKTFHSRTVFSIEKSTYSEGYLQALPKLLNENNAL